ncbi:ComEC/Rec2 family competence protein [Rhodococcus tukisamuensis]|uniref:Competence protein ComEC n=1 Tax=Rhodococcus tukisamuensis TaxID=168276 RepID=A0A1G7CYK7_9NOCA|nr:ComEC/Rec2 family competence protein [Rhodococcus tukisamuensis]SDE44534.1 competence protein ComEC [Rhodococcus tukisamuensis]
MTTPEARALDLRLLPSALMCWAATVFGIQFGWRAALWLAVGMAAVAALAAGIGVRAGVRDRLRREDPGPAGGRAARSGSGVRVTVSAGMLAALLVGAGFAVAVAAREHAAAAHPLAAVAARGGHANVTLAPVEDPRPVRSPSGDTVLIRATLRSMEIGGAEVEVGGTVVLFAPAEGWRDLLPRQRVRLRAEVGTPLRRDLTVAVLRAGGPPRSVAQASWAQRAAGLVRQRFAAASAAALPPDPAGLLPGLVVGDTSALPTGVRDDFTVAGLTHLTAVSGANVSILIGAVLLVLRALALGPRTCVAVAAIALVAFVIVARPSPSVLRAAMMGAVGLLALVTGRRKQAMPALGAAVIVLLAVAPALAVDFGFGLSVAATAALVLLAPGWAQGLRSRGWPRTVAEAVAVASAAHVVTAPIVAAMSGTVSTVAVLANLAAAPVVAFVTVVGALAALGAAAWPPLGELVAHAAGPPLWWLLWVARRAAAVPGATVSVPSGPVGAAVVAAAMLALWAAVRARRVRWLVAAAVLGLAAVWVPVRVVWPGWPVGDWVLVACDVGQGDALVLAAGGGAAVVVDAGPDPGPVAGCLDRLGVREVAAVVLTHLHADHVAGLPGVLRGRRVQELVLGPMRLPEYRFRQVRGQAASAGVSVRTARAGEQLRVGRLTMRVLGPTLPAPRDPADGADAANDQSLVLSVDTDVGRVLLTGDVEADGQRDLLRDGAPVRADVLKLPHHGSRTTTPEFLRAVGAGLVLVSVGAGNTFGHPNPGVLEEIRRSGATVARTDLSGDLAVSRSGGGATAISHRRRGTIVR